jgi:hypothetical protein
MSTGFFDEVDLDAGQGDHIGDLTEAADPNPTTRAAHSSSMQFQPGETHTNPEEAGEDLARYASSPLGHGVGVRQVVSHEWNGNTFGLTAGAQAWQLAEFDPNRSYLRVWNWCDGGPIFLANSPVQTPGPGVIVVPARDATSGQVQSVDFRSTAPVFLFTTPAFALGAGLTYVSWQIERMP